MKKEKVNSLTLRKVDSVSLKSSKPVFGRFFEKFRISNNGNYWVFAERIRDQIFVFKKNGDFINVLGERGKGPKGIIAISGFDINNKQEVFVYDAAQRMLKVFDLEGELKNIYEFLDESDFGTTRFAMRWYNGKILTSIIENKHMQEPQKSNVLALLSIEGESDTLFGVHDKYSNKDNDHVLENMIVIEPENKRVYVNLKSSPYFQEYSLKKFTRVGYYGIKSESFKNPDKEITFGMPASEIKKRASNTSFITGLFLTKKYIIQHMQLLTDEWFELADYTLKKNYLIIYDRDTRRFLNELPVKHTLGAVQNNKLYFIEDFNPDNYTIGIYEIVPENN